MDREGFVFVVAEKRCAPGRHPACIASVWQVLFGNQKLTGL
jgi:hypothetical protein